MLTLLSIPVQIQARIHLLFTFALQRPQASLFIFNCQKRHLPSFGLESTSLVLKIVYLNILHLLCQKTGINFQRSSYLRETRQNLDLMCSQSLRQIYWATKLPYRAPNTKVQPAATSYLIIIQLFHCSKIWFLKI